MLAPIAQKETEITVSRQTTKLQNRGLFTLNINVVGLFLQVANAELAHTEPNIVILSAVL